jgi:alcohol dehydrogenase (cytochrome c)
VKWKQPLRFPPSSLQVNRGVAYDNGRVFRGAGPGHVIALDAATGATRGTSSSVRFLPGMTVPMAPLAWNGMVFVGNAGGDNYGVTGHVWALDQKDGHTIWRFDVVPESGPARNSWRNAQAIRSPVGAFWTTFASIRKPASSWCQPATRLRFPARRAPGRQPVFEFGHRHRYQTGHARRLRAARQGGHARLGRGLPDRSCSRRAAGRQIIASANKDGLLSAIDRLADETPWPDTDDDA